MAIYSWFTHNKWDFPYFFVCLPEGSRICSWHGKHHHPLRLKNCLSWEKSLRRCWRHATVLGKKPSLWVILTYFNHLIYIYILLLYIYIWMICVHWYSSWLLVDCCGWSVRPASPKSRRPYLNTLPALLLRKLKVGSFLHLLRGATVVTHHVFW